jgi:hypothetical protein
MPGFDIQGQIAFKNLLGKSQTNDNNIVVNEVIGFGFDVPSFNIMMDTINPTASIAVTDGVAVLVKGVLKVINGTNGKGFRTFWPTTPPSGSDIKNNNTAFAYGVGSLEGVTPDTPMTNLISDSFDVSYQAVPRKSDGTQIPPLDDRDWVYQYNSGVFYQDRPNLAIGDPVTIDVYYYIGDRLLSQSKNTQSNIRVSATASVNSTAQDLYFATYSTPSIATYSTNYLFLVDFTQTNLSSTVSFNINGIGTTSVIKYTKDGPAPLAPGDITGATGGTSGQIYYLVYNNGLFEFYPKNPLSDSASFTYPADTPYSVGGIDVGTQFEKVSFQEMMKDLLYPDQLGKITSLSVSNNSGTVLRYEVGDELPRQVYTFSWGVNDFTGFKTSTLKLEDTTSSTVFTQSTGNNGPYGFLISTISNNTDATRNYKVSLTRNNGTIVSKFLNIPWMWSVYHGSSTWSTLTASQVFNLPSTLATQSVGSWTLSGTGYKYIAFPEDVSYNFNNMYYKGLPFAIAGTPSGYSYSYSEVNYLFVTVSNSFGIAKQYKVYRSKNIISATISVNII